FNLRLFGQIKESVAPSYSQFAVLNGSFLNFFFFSFRYWLYVISGVRFLLFNTSSYADGKLDILYYEQNLQKILLEYFQPNHLWQKQYHFYLIKSLNLKAKSLDSWYNV